MTTVAFLKYIEDRKHFGYCNLAWQEWGDKKKREHHRKKLKEIEETKFLNFLESIK